MKKNAAKEPAAQLEPKCPLDESTSSTKARQDCTSFTQADLKGPKSGTTFVLNKKKLTRETRRKAYKTIFKVCTTIGTWKPWNEEKREQVVQNNKMGNDRRGKLTKTLAHQVGQLLNRGGLAKQPCPLKTQVSWPTRSAKAQPQGHGCSCYRNSQGK